MIFCRNVLIYFDDTSRRIAAENLYENLFPGGFICLGHTESMSRISPLFDVARFADAIVYQTTCGVTTWLTTHANESSSSTTRASCGCTTAPLSRAPGFEVAEALNGLEALEQVLAAHFDLLIVDVNMPQMDGLSFLRTLRGKSLPVVVDTGVGHEHGGGAAAHRRGARGRRELLRRQAAAARKRWCSTPRCSAGLRHE